MVQSAALLTNRGVIHQFMGDLVNAMRDYQKAVSVQSDYSLAHFNIGNVLFQQRHFKQVCYMYLKGSKGYPMNELLTFQSSNPLISYFGEYISLYLQTYCKSRRLNTMLLFLDIALSPNVGHHKLHSSPLFMSG